MITPNNEIDNYNEVNDIGDDDIDDNNHIVDDDDEEEKEKVRRGRGR